MTLIFYVQRFGRKKIAKKRIYFACAVEITMGVIHPDGYLACSLRTTERGG